MTHSQYCTILGIDDSYTFDLIKKAFQRKVRKVHPDKNPHRDTTEEFKLVQEAYEYFKNQLSEDEELEVTLPEEAHILHIDVKITLQQIYNGGDIKLFFPIERVCPKCDGIGGKPIKCRECKNKKKYWKSDKFEVEKQIRKNEQDFYFNRAKKRKLDEEECNYSQPQSKEAQYYQNNDYMNDPFTTKREQTCKKCNGKGYYIISKCTECNGEANIQNMLYYLYIPPGLPNNTILQDTINGIKIFFKIIELPDTIFQRNGNNLVQNITNIALEESLQGYKFTTIHLDGRMFHLQCAEVIKPGDIFVLENEGMPIYGDRSKKRGDLHFKFKILFPTGISKPLDPDVKAIYKQKNDNDDSCFIQ